LGNFPWYYNDYKVGDEATDNKYNYQLIHMFYNDYTITSQYWQTILPIIKKLNPAAIVRVKAKMGALDTSALKGAEAMQKVNSVISDMAVNSVVLLAESLGKLLGGENVDLFAGFVGIMGSGLEEIGKALIAYGLAMDAFKKAFTNPYAAIAAGIALVAAGALLKSKISNTSQGGSNVQTFANGGIISGPTYGLMGEYPGASSNPEVVAPLDKLKDIIGGGGNQGGTFVLRGQDLLLSVNRAQKASNLKGQTISLA
jgi:hypothetical protein